MLSGIQRGLREKIHLILNRKDNISFYQFPILAAFHEIEHGIFTRNNGYSKEPFHSLNTSISIGDDINDVIKNRAAVASCMGGNELVFLKQVHGKKVVVYSDKNHPEDQEHDGRPPVGDAVITNLKNKPLVIQVADCQAVLLFDPVLKVLANIHSGWRGSIGNIIGAAVEAMADHFGSIAGNVVAGIGPSLGPCCAEFVNYKDEIPKGFWKYRDNTNHFNFWSISRDQLLKTGILKENIDSSHICTKCHTDEFFSYRGEVHTGRFAAVIGLVE